MLDAAMEAGADVSHCKHRAARFDNALEESVDFFNHEMDALKANKAEGNWAYILLNGYKNDAFSLLKNENNALPLTE